MGVSPLAPGSGPPLPTIAGLSLAVAETQVKYTGRPDLLLVRFDAGTQVAGVLTRSKTASAAVEYCREFLRSAQGARALIVNSGNANAFTGAAGYASCEAIFASVSSALNIRRATIYSASTGVIGEPLPVQKIIRAIPGMVAQLDRGGWHKAARAIMTTDTFAKLATRQTRIGDAVITINGIAKGSGMIAPDMATMLAFVFTDAAIDGAVLQSLLVEANSTSFNAITVDSDTSTSDTCLLFATGVAGKSRITDTSDPALSAFKVALGELMRDLARQIVRDGEGATKFIEVSVSGAQSRIAAHRIANAIANSPLVKTAVAGEDANWGRIVMAVGKSAEEVNRDALQISMGGVLITQNGQAVEGYDESLVAAHLQTDEIKIEVDVGVNEGAFTVYTCDLTRGYIAINADYRS